MSATLCVIPNDSGNPIFKKPPFLKTANSARSKSVPAVYAQCLKQPETCLVTHCLKASVCAGLFTWDHERNNFDIKSHPCLPPYGEVIFSSVLSSPLLSSRDHLVCLSATLLEKLARPDTNSRHNVYGKNIIQRSNRKCNC
jgi:hypothetical protein